MALTVTTDLTVLTTAETYASPPWYQVGSGLAPITEPDFYVQGSACISVAVSGAGTLKGVVFDNTSGIDFTSGTHKDKLVYIWLVTSTPGLCGTRTNGGFRIRLCTTSPTSNYREWYVDGSDTFAATDRWTCYVIDPQSAGTATSGSYNAASVRYFGGLMMTTTTAKGQNFGIDQIAYGRGEVYVSGTVTTAGLGFKEIADVVYDSARTNRWGIITLKQGIYFVRGKIIVGHATNNTTFSSYGEIVVWETPSYKDASNVVKTIPDASVGGTAGADGLSTYNGLAFQGGSGTTTIDLGVIVGTANGRSGSQLSCTKNSGLTTPGRTKAWVAVSDSTMALSLYASAFTGFEGGVDLYGTGVDDDNCFNCTFDTCERLRTNMTLRNCNILNSLTAVTDGAYLWESTTNLQNCLFVNNARAVVFESTSGTPFTFTNITFGSNTYDVRNESDGEITINVSGGTTPTVENAGSSTTILAINPVNTIVTVKDSLVPPVAIQYANVLVQATAGGPMPAGASVTIVNSGTTAIVTHSSHGMASNDKVLIKGASLQPNNGVFTITYINADSYSYTMLSLPGSSPTGSITSTYVALCGLTDGSGQITMSRPFTADQPISGRVRKATTGTLYKTSDFIGTISYTAGYSATIQLVPDQ